ncbi:uncharacterized protein L3040_000847 [Drepanopeziza brunnea f. sp. 'multigermtubi']|uniref:uncharacterized protein n=1 Tax=Drepanopeziza brunnea f. sp. 'multigermtubi' TaxID=698441 RepID=UPI0023924E76|nr:hypothetical protein L3040_000847 [Drepanopeziza brunnea f. sp. 'multigermtubi']
MTPRTRSQSGGKPPKAMLPVQAHHTSLKKQQPSPPPRKSKKPPPSRSTVMIPIPQPSTASLTTTHPRLLPPLTTLVVLAQPLTRRLSPEQGSLSPRPPLPPSRSRKTLRGHRSVAWSKDRVEAHHRPGFEAAPRAQPRWRENLAERLADAPEEKEAYLAQLRSLRALQRKLECWRLATHVGMRGWKKWNRRLLRDKRVVRSLERGERLDSGMKPWEMSQVWKASGLRLETKAGDGGGDGNGDGGGDGNGDEGGDGNGDRNGDFHLSDS